jgi:hypothetical protein
MDKYKDEIHKDIDINNKSKFNLIKTRKVKNVANKIEDEDKEEEMFEKYICFIYNYLEIISCSQF